MYHKRTRCKFEHNSAIKRCLTASGQVQPSGPQCRISRWRDLQTSVQRQAVHDLAAGAGHSQFSEIGNMIDIREQRQVQCAGVLAV